MKKTNLIALLSLLLITSACGNSSVVEPASVPTETETKTETAAIYDDTAARLKFADMLENMSKNSVLPDGRDVDADLGFGSVDENLFAVADVDGDSKDELVILYSTTDMADMTGYVLAYDDETGELYEELENFPSFTFYENGLIAVGWSHNQGHGEMWPYTLYTYDPETDTYKVTAIVDSWDEDIKPEDYPTDIDSEGAGTVYYLEKTDDVSDSDIYDESHLTSKSDYEKWYDEVGLNAEKIELSYETLTEENINALK